jgi:hypothetical protein
MPTELKPLVWIIPELSTATPAPTMLFMASRRNIAASLASPPLPPMLTLAVTPTPALPPA